MKLINKLLNMLGYIPKGTTTFELSKQPTKSITLRFNKSFIIEKDQFENVNDLVNIIKDQIVKENLDFIKQGIDWALYIDMDGPKPYGVLSGILTIYKE